MTEDDNLIYDIESSWGPCNSGKDKLLIFAHRDYPSLFRVIDIENKSYAFTDIKRVKRIRDINNVLIKEDNEELNKKLYQSIVNKVIDDIYPFTMPYKPQTLTCFIEAFKGFSETIDTLGILYYRDETDGMEKAQMIEAKKYFRIHPIGMRGPVYEELPEDVYIKVKEDFIRKDWKEGSNE